jgi:TonB family protein
MIAIESPKDRLITFAATLLVFGLIILFLILFLIHTPIPPYPPSIIQTVEIDFAGGGGLDGAEGMGNPTPSGNVKSMASAEGNEEDVLTSKVEDPNLEVKERKVKSRKKKTVKKQQETKSNPALEDPQPSEELRNLINNVKDKLKTSSGNSNNSEGNGKAGEGDGSGKGTGEGTGIGSHKGPGRGNGYSLNGRKLLQRPQLLDNSQEEGTVVVEIIVDENGRVIDANPGQRGSTTASSYLYTLARQAAKTARFNASPDGAKEQKGTYTFVFKLD